MRHRRPITISPSDPSWPAYAALIIHQLSSHLSSASVPYLSIQHIGSTSILGLAAKPIIDIAILVGSPEDAIAARDVLIFEPEGREHYVCIGDGGIKGRYSMKFCDKERKPERSVYILCEAEREGRVGWRGYMDLRRVLRGDEGLRREYEGVKRRLVEGEDGRGGPGMRDGVVYGRGKNEVVAKILRKAGWEEGEVREKEALDTRGLVGEEGWWEEDEY